MVITPFDASKPGIIANVAKILADKKISIKHAVAENCCLIEEPKLPPEIIQEIKELKEVKSVTLY